MHIWSFNGEIEPEPIKKAFLPSKKQKEPLWVAPEHVRMAQDMRRDYPRNDKGERIEGKAKELKIDKRPTIMVPARKTRIAYK